MPLNKFRMKLYLFSCLFLLAQAGFSQVAMTFEEASQNGMSFTTLDSIYMSGINANPELAVFCANQEEYVLAYKQLLTDLGIYLKEHGFIWDGPTKAFNRIYFNKAGEIDYFLY